MKKIVMSLMVLGALLGNAHEAKAQEYITKTIDTFNVVQEPPLDANSVTCLPLTTGVYLPYPCLLVGTGVDPGTGDPYVPNAQSSESGLPTADVLGGSRQMSLTYFGRPGFTDINAALILTPPPDDPRGILTLDNSDDAFSTANVKWGGESTGIPDFDLSSYESQLAYYDDFVLGVYFVDTNTEVTIEVTSLDDQVVRLTKGVVNESDNLLEVLFSLNDPDWQGNRNVFRSPIKSIALILSGSDTFDANIDFISLRKLIPEPSLVWGSVMALGTGMISTYRRRKLP